ncbi:transposase [Cytobacillus oceanisediminis]|uniref:transposase n=1 Tax=Cytobacillus oceanisediminis TaxID=665099 RepID=UPI003735DFA5
MARLRRVWSPPHFHHVVSRGNWRDYLFKDDQDFLAFIYILDHVHQGTKFEICSYCLMGNHFHLMLRSEKVPLSTVMRKINKSYADYYNTRYSVSGHLFEKRYFSKPIYDSLGLLEVSRYIHMNPVEANISNSPQDYKWSSYTLFSSRIKHPNFFNPAPIHSLFPGKTPSKQKKHYCAWMKDDFKLFSLKNSGDRHPT